MNSRQLTDTQLRAVIHHIAQIYLEVERGLRPPHHLGAFLTHNEYQRHRAHPRPLVPQEGPVQPRDLGRIHLDRPATAQITATILARQAGDRWGALIVHLRDTNQGWKVDQLERLERAPRIGRRLDTEPEPQDLAARIRRVEEERRTVAAAHGATSTRLDELFAAQAGGGPPGEPVQGLRQQIGMWTRRLAELDHELETLNRTLRLREHIATLDLERSPVDAPSSTTTDSILKVLGPRPNDARWTKIWDQTADELRHYRQRWHITDPDLALGPVTDEPEQARHRQLLVQMLRAVTPRLEHCRQRERGIEQVTPGIHHTDVSSGLGVEL